MALPIFFKLGKLAESRFLQASNTPTPTASYNYSMSTETRAVHVSNAAGPTDRHPGRLIDDSFEQL